MPEGACELSTEPGDRKDGRPAALVEVQHLGGGEPHSEANGYDTPGRRPRDEIEVLRDPQSRILFPGGEDRSGKRALDPASVERKNPKTFRIHLCFPQAGAGATSDGVQASCS